MLKRNLNTPKPSRGLLCSIIMGFTALSALFAAASAAFLAPRGLLTQADDSSFTPDPDEDLIARTELAVNINDSSITETSQAVGVTFRSRRIEAWPNGSLNLSVYVVPLDEEWTLKKAKDEAAAAKEEATAKGEEYVPIQYEAAVFNIVPTAQEHVVIPEFVNYGKSFSFHVTTIRENCCFNADSDEISYGNIKDIVIPKSITTIELGAFPLVPETTKLLVEAPERDEESNLTYGEGWTDATPEYNHVLTDAEKKLTSVNTTLSKLFGDGADFFLGISDEEYDYPLYMEYKLGTKGEDGQYHDLSESKFAAVPRLSLNNNYDAVGSTMGVDSIKPYINVDIPQGKQVVPETIVFHNIFHAVSEIKDGVPTGRMVPDVAEGPGKVLPVIDFDYVPSLADYFNVTPTSVTTMGDFFQAKVNFKINPGSDGSGVYSLLNPNVFAANKASIDNGSIVVRYQFSSLDQASYRFTIEKDGALTTITKRLRTPISYVNVGGRSFDMGFLVDVSEVPDVDASNIRRLELCNFCIKLDLWRDSTHSIILKSDNTVRFAALTLVPDRSAMAQINLPAIMVWTYVIFVAVYIAAAVGYYFYAKRRFRNDEFRRMNKKRYLISAIKNFVGTGLIVSAVLFIISRWGLMNTSVVVFNPLDAFVVAFTIVALIYIGFTIKNIVMSFKNARKRRQALRLKLDQDVVDDGTN